ncbi:MAG TPA: hypothetical protein VF832_05110, partial [Longimicrobiales bacterium]
MLASTSGLRSDADQIVTSHIPLLTVAAVAVLFAYPLTAGLQRDPTYGLDWLAAMAMAAWMARAVVGECPVRTRYWVGMGFGAALPLAACLLGFAAGSQWLAIHGAVSALLMTLAWLLTVGVIEECAGLNDDTLLGRKPVWQYGAVGGWFSPGRKSGRKKPAKAQARPTSTAFSGTALACLAVLGALELAGGEALRSSAEGSALPTPVPFAIAVFVLVGLLVSLSKLVEQARKIPRSVQVTGWFAREWLARAAVVLAAIGLVALLVPKSIATRPGQAAKDYLWQQLPRNDASSPTDSAGSWARRFEGLNRSTPGGAGQDRRGQAQQGRPQQAGAQQGVLARALDRAARAVLDALAQAATAGEGQEQGQGQGKAGASNQDRQQGPQAASAQQGQGSQQETASQAWKRLERLVRERPMRVLKLILFMLAATLGVFFVRRYLWPFLVALAGKIARKVVALYGRVVDPWRARRAEQRRQQGIAHILAAATDPFADPFAGATGPLTPALAEAAYASFCAHVGLLGSTRRESQTAFDFAQSVCSTTALASGDVWAVTNGCVQVHFSGEGGAEQDAARVCEALARVVTAVGRLLPRDVLQAKKAE